WYFCLLSLSCFFLSSRRRHTRSKRDWSSDVCSSHLHVGDGVEAAQRLVGGLHLALQQGAADPGGGDAPGARPLGTELVDRDDVEAEGPAQLPHRADVSRVAAPEQRVLPEHDALHPQAL